MSTPGPARTVTTPSTRSTRWWPRPGRSTTRPGPATPPSVSGRTSGETGSEEPVQSVDTSVFFRTSMAGVKRKGLASELLAAKADSYHTSWVSAWDTLMPAELLAKVGLTLLGWTIFVSCTFSVSRFTASCAGVRPPHPYRPRCITRGRPTIRTSGTFS